MSVIRATLIRIARWCCWAADRISGYDHDCPDHGTDVIVGTGCPNRYQASA